MTKQCSKCKAFKDESEFHKRSSATNGLTCQCKQCTAVKSVAYYEANRERILKEKVGVYRRLTPEQNRRKSAKHKKKHRFSVALSAIRCAARKNGYRACEASVEYVRDRFTGHCYLCNKAESSQNHRLCIDHDHETGMFRGWLCHKCNAMLGLSGDNPKMLRKAAGYLSRCQE